MLYFNFHISVNYLLCIEIILKEVLIVDVWVVKSFRVQVQTIAVEVTSLSYLEILLLKE